MPVLLISGLLLSLLAGANIVHNRVTQTQLDSIFIDALIAKIEPE